MYEPAYAFREREDDRTGTSPRETPQACSREASRVHDVEREQVTIFHGAVCRAVMFALCTGLSATAGNSKGA